MISEDIIRDRIPTDVSFRSKIISKLFLKLNQRRRSPIRDGTRVHEIPPSINEPRVALIPLSDKFENNSTAARCKIKRAMRALDKGLKGHA